MNCNACNGNGELDCPKCLVNGSADHCDHCNGDGVVICYRCNGRGWLDLE